MKSKRLFTFVMAVVMMFSVCTTLPMKISLPLEASAAYENTHTNTGNQRADIVAIAQTQVGYHEGSLEGTTNGSDNYTKYNKELYAIDGSYKYMWCQSFIAWCAKQAGVPSSVIKRTAGTVDAMDFFKAQGVWQGRNYTPQSGDIIYFTSSSSNSGYHVGIVESVSCSTINTIEGNYSNKVARHSVTVGSSSIVGYGVPNYSNLNPPTDLSISADKGYYAVGETVNFTFTHNNATELYIPIDVNGTREHFISVTDKNSYSCSFDKPGWYCYSLYGKNNCGDVLIEFKEFIVYDSAPSNMSISADKEYYAVGETVNFTFTHNNATELYIPIDVNGTREHFINVTDKNSYSCSFDKPGIYGFFLYGKNLCGESSTVDNYLQFEIYDNRPSELSIHTDKTLYVVGEKINFSFSSKNATELYIPIDYNGKRSNFIDVTGENSYSCTFDKPGTYGFFLYGKNKFGETSTVDEYLEFKILSNQKGDANNDGELTVADAVMLQKWILGSGSLTNWENADLCKDGRIDVFDMIEMRKLIVNSLSAQ